jgi:predicted ATPase
MHALAEALCWAAVISYCERDPAEVERYASEFVELSTRYSFAHWRAVGAIYKGWARSASGDTAAGVVLIEDGIRDWLETGAVRIMPVWLSLKAEALYLAGRTPETLEAIEKAVALSEGSGEREWYPELHRLRGVFLAAVGAEETQIEASFHAAIKVAKEQKSVSLATRAEASYAEYCRQKASGSGEHRFRLPLW